MKNIIAFCFFLYLNLCSISSKQPKVGSFGAEEHIMTIFNVEKPKEIPQYLGKIEIKINKEDSSIVSVIKKPKVNSHKNKTNPITTTPIDEKEIVKNDYHLIKSHILNKDFAIAVFSDEVDDSNDSKDEVSLELKDNELGLRTVKVRFFTASSNLIEIKGIYVLLMLLLCMF